MTPINHLLSLALKEDIGSGDITTNNLIPAGQTNTAFIIAKEPGIIAGLPLISAVYKRLNRNITVKLKAPDGARVKPGQVIAIIKGPTRAILTGERTVLNFLQRLAGIATLTAQFVSLAKPYGVKILDTRKTMPGWRLLDKYAVKTGGGFNHRMSLDDAVLIKNNHLKNASLIKILERIIKSPVTKNKTIEIEVKNLTEFILALIFLNTHAIRQPMIMLDNMTPSQIKEAVIIRNKTGRQVRLEASGGINLANIAKFASTGVDYISVGALTHSPKALDLALRVN